MPSSLIHALGIIDCIILKRVGENEFELLLENDAWCNVLLPEARQGHRFEIPQDSAFLFDFLHDAEPFWTENRELKHHSGIWSESFGNETLRFEAIAANVDDEHFLVVCNQQQEYLRQQKTLQVARELLLSNDKMLAQYDYMHERLDQALHERQSIETLQAPIVQAIESANFGVIITDNKLNPVSVNPATLKMFDLPQETDKDVPFQTVMSLFEKQFPEFDRVFTTASRWNGELFWHKPPSIDKWLQVAIYPVKNDNLAIQNWLLLINDVSRIKFLLKSNERLSMYDKLTQLPNRQFFWESLNASIDAQVPLFLLYIDVKHFKHINELYGHLAGDEVLGQLAQRLAPLLKRNDVIARIGGDEFAILLHNTSDYQQCRNFAQQLIETLDTPIYTQQNQRCQMGLNIGAAHFPSDTTDAEDLMKYADLAMYEAKKKPKSSIQFYSHELEQASLKRIEIEESLRRAIKEEQFELYLQPMLDLDTGRIIKAEALLRWHLPDGSLASPDDFIPIAEQSGLIVPMGKWVLSRACQMLNILQQYNPDLKLSVNLSPRQVGDRHLLEFIRTLIERTGVAPNTLELELTEGVLVDNYAKVQYLLDEVRKLGITVSIDDFGTGYSSLSYLQKLPIDHLKIDRSFVQDLDSNDGDQAIVLAVIAMAHSLKLGVIAEGVETEQQKRFLRENQCDSAQGYLFSRPVPLDDFCQQLLTETQQPDS